MPRSVLIVEDEAIIRASLREFLSAEGYQVAEAGTLAAAIVHARQRDFHVVICDVLLLAMVGAPRPGLPANAVSE